jgi:hypothetical protein
MKILLLLLSSMMAFANPASAQNICTAPGSHVGLVSAALLQKPIEMQTDIGSESLVIPAAGQLAGAPTEVLQYYKQGLAFLYLFDYVDSVRSFNMAVRANPDFALGYLGLVRAYLDLDGAPEAAKALEIAKSLSATMQLTDIEKKWITAVSDVYDYQTGQQQDSQILKASMDALTKADPTDAEILAYTSYFSFNEAGLLAVLAINPNHVAAHHYLTHLYEGQGKYSLAQAHARAAIHFATSSWHAQHMLAHTLPMTGQWQEAEGQLAIADQLTRAWFKKENAQPEDDWHYAHNLDLYAFVEHKLNHKEKAETLFLEKCAIRPAEQNCLSIVDFYLTEGRYQDAQKILDDKLWSEIYSSGSTNNLILAAKSFYGEAQLGLGQTYKAIALQKEVEAGSNPNGSALTLRALKYTLMIQKKPDVDQQNQIANAVLFALAGHDFDAWSRGLIVAERLAIQARLNSLTDLEARILTSIHKIDPDFKTK